MQQAVSSRSEVYDCKGIQEHTRTQEAKLVIQRYRRKIVNFIYCQLNRSVPRAQERDFAILNSTYKFVKVHNETSKKDPHFDFLKSIRIQVYKRYSVLSPINHYSHGVSFRV